MLQNFSYTIFANLVNLLVTAFVVLIISKILGVTEYGLFQTYLFYSSYWFCFQFGWNDGVFLRYGGFNFEELESKTFSSEFMKLFFLQLLLFIAGLAFINKLQLTHQLSFVLVMVVSSISVMGCRQFFLVIFQATNRVSQYTFIQIIDRVIFLIFVIASLMFRKYDFRILILGDFLGHLITLLISYLLCMSLIKIKYFFSVADFKETWKNISVGMKLLLSNVSSYLVVGVIRFGIQLIWGIEVFGKLSLTLTFANLILTFVSAVGMVLFPILRRVNREELSDLYVKLRVLLMTCMFVLLLLYFPIMWVMPRWLPNYAASLRYLAIIFPLSLFDSKFEILVATFLKTVRMERELLVINLFTVMFSAFIVLINIVFIRKEFWIMFSVIFVLAMRSSISEIYMSKYLNIHIYKDLITELLIIGAFMFLTWKANIIVALIGYTIILMMYICVNLKNIKKNLKYFINNGIGGIVNEK